MQKISLKISRRMSELIEESQDSTRLYDSLLSSLPLSKDMIPHHGYEIWECGLIVYPLTSMCNKLSTNSTPISPFNSKTHKKLRGLDNSSTITG